MLPVLVPRPSVDGGGRDQGYLPRQDLFGEGSWSTGPVRAEINPYSLRPQNIRHLSVPAYVNLGLEPEGEVDLSGLCV